MILWLACKGAVPAIEFQEASLMRFLAPVALV
jgi:hypothetical protein